jgi:hypothetical protein
LNTAKELALTKFVFRKLNSLLMSGKTAKGLGLMSIPPPRLQRNLPVNDAPGSGAGVNNFLFVIALRR